MNIDLFVSELSSLQFPQVFNPYRDICPHADNAISPAIRTKNLTRYLNQIGGQKVDSIWFGRDLGYRGGRRTGLALTDEVYLPTLANLLNSKSDIIKATVGPTVKERTAADIWGMISKLNKLPFLWNIFPLHPYEYGDQLTNRPHTKNELDACSFFTKELISWLGPQHIIALGNDAAKALNRMGIKNICIRHPSYGGQAEFNAGISHVYGLNRKP